MRHWIGKLKCWLGQHDWREVTIERLHVPAYRWLDGSEPFVASPRPQLVREVIGHRCRRCDYGRLL